MTERFCDPGSGESVKGAVHGAVLTLALMCGLYNACAWRRRRLPRLAVNACLYAGLVVFEMAQVWRHGQ